MPIPLCNRAYVRFDGGKLKELRSDRKWDQHRLAEAARSHGVGITQSQVSRYENGQEPSGRNVMALAAALGIEVKDLYGEPDAEAASMTAATADTLYEALRAIVRTEVREALGKVPA